MHEFDAKRVILVEDGSLAPGKDIIFSISKNGLLQYDGSSLLTIDKDNATITLLNYSGEICVPPKTGIYVSNVNNNIEGIIASPAVFSGSGNMNMMIDYDSDLQLCLYCEGLFRSNEGFSKDDKKIFFEGNYLGADQPFIHEDIIQYRRAYNNEILDIINEGRPVISEDKKKRSIDFTRARYEGFNDLDICMTFNLVTIIKYVGPINLYYVNPKTDMAKRIDKGNSMTKIKFLETENDSLTKRMDEYTATEKYEVLGRINEIITKNQEKIKIVKNHLKEITSDNRGYQQDKQ